MECKHLTASFDNPYVLSNDFSLHCTDFQLKCLTFHIFIEFYLMKVVFRVSFGKYKFCTYRLTTPALYSLAFSRQNCPVRLEQKKNRDK